MRGIGSRWVDRIMSGDWFDWPMVVGAGVIRIVIDVRGLLVVVPMRIDGRILSEEMI